MQSEENKMFLGDYHTHTRDSDGFGTEEQSMEAARARGLKELAITDHGFGNCRLYSQRWKGYVAQRRRIEDAIASGKAEGLRVYHGIEADILTERGDLDLTPGQLDAMQILLAGFHPLVFAGVRDWCTFCAPILLTGRYRPQTIRRNTRAAIAAIKRYPIDIWVHPNELMVLDLPEVAKAAADYGTLLEVNIKHLGHFERNQSHDIFQKVLDTGVGLVVDTDAHWPERIAAYPGLDAYLGKHGVTPDIFQNFNKTPTFVRQNQRSGQLSKGLEEES